MRITLGCNWDPALLEGIRDIPEVCELMASMPSRVVGTDRPVVKHPKATPEQVAAYVERAHGMGRTVNFLLNSPSVAGRQAEPDVRARVRAYVGWLTEIGVDAVTVSAPSLLELVRLHFPKLPVHVSHNAGVTTAQQVRCWEELGASAICLLRLNNRNLPVLRRLAAHARVPLQVTCLSVCVVGCPMKVNQYHLSTTCSLCTEGRQPNQHNRHGHLFNVAWCHEYRLTRGEEMVKGCFLRPEDLGRLEEIGIHSFKLDTRTVPTAGALLRAGAYAARRYDGDLSGLLNLFHMAGFRTPGGAGAPARGRRPEEMDLEEVTAALTGIADRIDFARLLRYDNRALDGYMERQATAGCPPSCRSCDYCSRWAGRAQEWDAGLRDELLGYIRRYRLLMLSR